jgi:hypothetical protein
MDGIHGGGRKASAARSGRRSAIVAAMVVCAGGCGANDAAGGASACAIDADCQGARICSSGQCVDPAGSGGSYGTGGQIAIGGGSSTKGGSCAGSGDCAKDLKCVAQVCVPSLPSGFCQTYATLCEPTLSVSQCESDCVTTATKASSDDCWFKACGAEVGKCDGQEPNDTSITQCATAHGWKASGTTSPGTGGAGGGSVQSGVPTSAKARVVGYWGMADSSGCTGAGGASWSNYVYALCPDGRVVGGGEMTNGLIEVVCGTYTVTPRTYDNCTDENACFDRVSANVKVTSAIGGVKDVGSTTDTLYADVKLGSPAFLMTRRSCLNGSAEDLYFDRSAGTMSNDYCVSSLCPASGSSSGGYGSCSADCDCGQCWYCESGTCRYAGAGPYGCYRGCSF